MSAPQKTNPLATLKLIGAGSSFQQELCAMLEGNNLFNDLQWAEIQALARHMQAYEAEKGKVLFHEGEPGHYLCIIVKGKVDIHKEDSAHANKIIASVGPGKTLGEMSVIDGEPRSATATAAMPTTFAILSQEHLTQLMKESPALAAKVLLKMARLLSQRLRQSSGLLVDYLGQENNAR